MKSTSIFKTTWFGFAAAIWLLLLCTFGCNSNLPAVHPVTGKVIFQGKPIADALVTFHPKSSESMALSPIGVTNSDGEFHLTSFRTNDGAAAGEYQVTVEMRQWRDEGGERTQDGPNILPPQYATPQKSPIQYDVHAFENRIPDIVIN